MGNVFCCNPTEYKQITVPGSSDSQKTTKTMDSFTNEKSNEYLCYKPLPIKGRPGLVWVGKIKGDLGEESLNQSVNPTCPIEHSVVDQPTFRTLAQRQDAYLSVDINSNDTRDKCLHENKEIPTSFPKCLSRVHATAGPCIFEQIVTCTVNKILAEIIDGEQQYQEDQSIFSATSEGASGNPFDEVGNVPMTAERRVSDPFGRAVRWYYFHSRRPQHKSFFTDDLRSFKASPKEKKSFFVVVNDDDSDCLSDITCGTAKGCRRSRRKYRDMLH
ncbi:hypothetical protein IV203_015232 [Nitzschia inconspicua]|uniref:Uncharacterized protein n=1 Tax=Nitzschia inconspicua TaxID=303405 RepID=A0A9K3LAX0_9STRA|nr:hypothetical protein IV203_015232 [Nitzschia inconspicua]